MYQVAWQMAFATLVRYGVGYPRAS